MRAYTACSSTSLLGLLYFLVAGAAVRSLPAGAPLCEYPLAPAISCPQGRGNYRKQDEHPGQEGSGRAGRGGRRR